MAADDLFDATPIPPLAPDAMGVPPMGPPPPVPVAPTPANGSAHQWYHLLAGALAAGLGPGAGTGLLQGMNIGQQRADHERQIQQAQAQTQYNQTRTDWEQQQKLNQQELDKRSQTFQTNVQSLRKTTAGLKTKEQYDSYITAYANGLQGMGYKVDANYLRSAAPYVAPSATKQAQDVLTKWMGSEMNKTLLKDDPQRAMTSIVPFDRDGDGVPEKVTIGDLGLLAGMFSADPKTGAPMFAPAGTVAEQRASADGILADLVAQDKAEGKLPTPQRMVELKQKAIRLAGEAKPERPSANGMSESDPEAIADAIQRGDQPPTLQGLYRFGAPVRSILAKKGFNLADAQSDWAAVQKHLATLNGTQQTRMRQGIDNASHSLDVIESLATQWDAGKFPILNRGRLAAAKQGLLGPQAQQIATQLEAQISDVTAELGNVYMGGNSPTDHALDLAKQNLSADWNKAQLLSAIKLARTNLTIRQNSMKNAGAIGVSENNPYGGPPPAATPAAAPSEQWARDPKTGKMVKQ